MMDDDVKIKEWKYEFAWKLRDITQEANDRIDQKAINLINFISLLIPIITGVVLFSIEKSLFQNIRLFWGISLIPLFLGIIFAFKTIWLTDQKIINVHNHFNKSSVDTKIEDILEKTANDFADWQNFLNEDVSKKKSKFFLRSSYCFVISLFIIAVSSLLSFF